MLDKPLTRRAALSFIGGAGAGGLINATLNLVDKPTVPLANNSELPESCLTGNIIDRFESHISTYNNDPRRITDQIICKKRAQKESSIGSGISKEEFIKRAVYSSSVLPDRLKGLICYIPYEESKFNTFARSGSNPPAVGTWQFMPGTAANPAMVGSNIMVDNDGDRRSNFELSTKAAVKYFEYIYQILVSDPNYQILQSRYHLDNNTFLSLAVLHAYNAGEGHMQRAFQVMANESTIRKQIDRCGEQGDLGLYIYLTEEYSRDPKKWQTVKPYFYRESSAYAYKVLAFQRMDQPSKTSAAKKPSVPAVPEQKKLTHGISSISGTARSAIGGVGGLLGWSGIERGLNKIMGEPARIDRRTFVAGLSAIVGGALGATGTQQYINYHASKELRESTSKIVPIATPIAPSADLPEKTVATPAPLAVLNSQEILANRKVLQQVYARTQSAAFITSHQNQHILVKDLAKLPASSKFLENMHLADAAYELYQAHSQEIYLQFAKYYYERSLTLTEQQLAGKIEPPPAKNKAAAREIIKSRKTYLLKALQIINTEFSNQGD